MEKSGDKQMMWSFDLDAELKIWISGNSVPLQKKFNKATDIYAVQRVLAEKIFSSQ